MMHRNIRDSLLWFWHNVYNLRVLRTLLNVINKMYIVLVSTYLTLNESIEADKTVFDLCLK